jgi:hypothetical protein
MTAAPLIVSAMIMSVGTHALLLWTRRQQLVHAIRRARLVASDSPFGDDPTCFIEGLSLRALAVTLTIDIALDVFLPLVAMQMIALPLFDVARLLPLEPLQILLMRAIAVALICAPCACASLVYSRAIHLASRSSSVMLSLRRAPNSVNFSRLCAMVVMRDAVALSVIVLALTLFESSLRPSPFGCALPLAVGAVCGAVLSHPFDSLALDAASAASAVVAAAEQQQPLWLGVAPRTARLTMITVCVPFWFTLVSMATTEVAEAAR